MKTYEELMNQRVQEIPPSGIRKFFDVVAMMEDAISLGVGEDIIPYWCTLVMALIRGAGPNA